MAGNDVYVVSKCCMDIVTMSLILPTIVAACGLFIALAYIIECAQIDSQSANIAIISVAGSLLFITTAMIYCIVNGISQRFSPHDYEMTEIAETAEIADVTETAEIAETTDV